MATGIRVRHARSCRFRDGGRCNCAPTYQAQAYDSRTGRQVWRTFPTISAAKLWRQDVQVALRRGTMRAPTSKTIAVVPGGEREAADRLNAYLNPPTVALTVAHRSQNEKNARDTGLLQYRYRDSNPGFRRERAAS